MPEEGLTRISEDPTILSGTLRSTLDVFDEYQDAEIVSIIDAAYSCYTHLSFLV
jgi:ABC-type multidrug transport system fused ATPase/permease subunit